jgi:hypothetical protein
MIEAEIEATGMIGAQIEAGGIKYKVRQGSSLALGFPSSRSATACIGLSTAAARQIEITFANYSERTPCARMLARISSGLLTALTK